MFYFFTKYSTSSDGIDTATVTSIQRGSKEYIYREAISGFTAIDEMNDASLRIAVVCCDDRPFVQSLFHQLRQAADKDFSLEEKLYIPTDVIAASTDSTLTKNAREMFNARVDEESPANSEKHIYYSRSRPFCMGYFHSKCTDLGQFNDILGLEVLLPLLCHTVNNLVSSTFLLNDISKDVQTGTFDSMLPALRTLAMSEVKLLTSNYISAANALKNINTSEIEEIQELKQRIQITENAISQLRLLPGHFRLILNLPSELFGGICSAVANGQYPCIDRVVWVRSDDNLRIELAGKAVKRKHETDDLTKDLQGFQDDVTVNASNIHSNAFFISWVKELPDFAGLNLDNLKIHIDKDITSARTNTNENRTNIKNL